MQPSLDPADLACPVCHHTADLLDVVDFNTSCEQARGRHFALSGVAVYYALCGNCGFGFAPQMRHWTTEQWKERVYNTDYARVDPDHAQRRPLANVALLRELLGTYATKLRHLDYGGGTGLLAATLAKAGCRSVNWDPMVSHARDLATLGPFDLITAFEVAEHAPDPQALFATWRSLLDPGGVVLFSTLLSDGHLIPNQRLNWWYAAPRNGHVSLYNAKCLDHLARLHDWKCTSLTPSLHVLHAEVPPWAAEWLRG